MVVSLRPSRAAPLASTAPAAHASRGALHVNARAWSLARGRVVRSTTLVLGVLGVLGVGALVLGVGGALAGCAEPEPLPRACNGHVELCDRALDGVVFAGAHNAMSSRDDGFAAPNQLLAVPGQLRLGVRAFLLDTKAPRDGDGHVVEDGVLLCHGACSLGSVSLVEELRRLKTFLDAEPDTVVQLLIEDDASIADTRAAFATAGLLDELYVHVDGAAFPTLGALIDARTRIFVTAESGTTDPDEPWLHAMFTLVQDTPFTFATIDELEADPSCALNRGDAASPLFLVNHWLGNPLPDETLAAGANTFAVLDERVRRCAVARDRTASIVAVDFVDIGDVVAVVDGLNGFEQAGQR